MSELMKPEPYQGFAIPSAFPAPYLPMPRPSSVVSPSSIALALACPAVTTSLLLLARHWSEHGARHSIGDMVPLGIGAVIGLAASSRCGGEPLLAATCASLSGSCVALGAMAYPTGLAEPLIAWGLATVTGWVLARRHVRSRAIRHEEYGQRQADRDHQTNLATISGQTAIGVATIQAQAQIESTRITALAELQAANIRVDAIEFRLWQNETADRRRALMATPPTREELAPVASHADAESVLGDVAPARSLRGTA